MITRKLSFRIALILFVSATIALTACGQQNDSSSISVTATPEGSLQSVQPEGPAISDIISQVPEGRLGAEPEQSEIGGAIGAGPVEQTNLPPQTIMPPAPPTSNVPVAPTPEATGVPAATAQAAQPPVQPGTVYKNYIVRSGDNLELIASRMGVSMSALMKLNSIRNPDYLQVGQVLRVGATVQAGRGPGAKIIPDSEAVYSPAYQGFDVNAIVQKYGGYLAHYSESVDGQNLTGAQIVQLVSERFSVGPRVLLTLLELEGGWLTRRPQNNTELYYPMAYTNSSWSGLYRQVWFAADKLNEGYYSRVYGNPNNMTLLDGSVVTASSQINPGTAALQDFLAYVNDYKHWTNDLAGFSATYGKLFGDPFSQAIEPLVPADLKQPTLQLPWQQDLTWYLTGGPHGGWADGSAWAAIDFAPGEGAGTCWPSAQFAAAAAPGLVVQAEHGRVMENLEGKNFQGVGWTLMYMHMSSTGRVAIGTRVNTGDLIGRPSCEGGYSEADHLHFARLYNGQWIAAADRKIPMVISDWKVIGGSSQYDGSLARGSQVIESCNCNSVSINGVPWSASQSGASGPGNVVENSPSGNGVAGAAAGTSSDGGSQQGGSGSDAGGTPP